MRSTDSPLWMKDILDRDQLAETPTREIPAIRLPQHTPIPDYQPRRILPRDRQGRPYLSVIDPSGYTLEVVRDGVNQFMEIQQCAPVVILLSASRYLEYGMHMEYFYLSNGKRIPYGFEPGCSYDVVVRGAFDGN